VVDHSPQLEILPYEDAKHAGFVFAPVRKLAGTRYHRQRTAHSLALQLRKEMAVGRAYVVADRKDPETLVACAVWRSNAIAWCFVRPGCRRRGVARWLCRSNFADGPVGVVFWTPVAEKLAARGLPIYPL
jgi:hypothetical protein